MNPQTYRLCVLVDEETGAEIEGLMAKTRRRKSTVIREAIEKGMRQMQREQELLEQMQAKNEAVKERYSGDFFADPVRRQQISDELAQRVSGGSTFLEDYYEQLEQD